MKRLQTAVLSIVSFMLLSATASAHVIVKPAEVLTGSVQTFTMGVPNEKDNPTVKMKLLIPSGLQYVSPTVKTGWTITTEKSGDGDTATVTAITWDGGSIPAGFRDDFTFSAKAPDTAGQLDWKAYQTYENGVTVAWDQKPSTDEKDDDTAPTGPYSVTSVVKNASDDTTQAVAAKASDTPKYLSIAAIVIALVAFAAATRKGRK